MSVLKLSLELRSLRNQPLWTLLAATKAPLVLALLQQLLLDGEKVLPSSVLQERLTRQISQLRAAGEEMERSPQAYMAEWLAHGWLVRRFPPGATEEEYELSVEAVNGIRFIQSIMRPRAVATESRLQTVIQQVSRLAEETDANPQSRLEVLLAERARIDQDIEAVGRGVVKTIPDDRALERAREIISLADDLASDFRRVRDAFADLARHLRQSLVEGDESRGEILERLFAGIDVIAESVEGRTFAAFWRLLTDPVQSTLLQESLRDVIGRPFAKELARHERRFLSRLTSILSTEGGAVQDVQQNFARSLKSFVQSREFLEHRRVHSLLRVALKSALQVKDVARPGTKLDYALTLTNASIRSISQVRLDDPSTRVMTTAMEDARPADIDLETVSEMLRQSEIDFRALKSNIAAALADRSQVSIAELLQIFPANQGLGTVVGYIALGTKHGEIVDERIRVTWAGLDGQERSAFVPTIYFLRERSHELAR